ncbi:MAG: DUF3102 domain-containing protein [Spirochaetia bacterium]|nr:DUF3102 domain-containing protein [Spirochaetia bacterium]
MGKTVNDEMDSAFSEKAKSRLPEIEVDPDVKLIRDYFKDIERQFNNALDNAIKIGEILTNKKNIPGGHGNFTPWINKNFDFDARTARNYMRLFEHQEHFKNRAIGLTEAYKELSAKQGEEPPKDAPLQIRKKFHEGKKLNNTEKEILSSYLKEKLDSIENQRVKIENELKEIENGN